MKASTVYTVLSIDDSRAVHAFLDRCLRETNNHEFTFLHALSAKEGLQLLEQKDALVAAVILDWEMPEMSGFDALPIFRERFPNLPVVILTSKNRLEEIKTMLDRGAADYMMKPLTAEILIEKLRSLTGRH